MPDGTSAMVRCPTCKTIFSPIVGTAPSTEDDEEADEPKEKPKAQRKAVRDEKPQRRKNERPKQPDENRDFDPVNEDEDRKHRRKTQRLRVDDDLSPEERAARKAAFQRAAFGVKLIWVSLGLFILSMVLLLVYYFQTAFIDPILYFVTLAGVVGLLNWLLAAVGVGLCLSGPRVPGHWGYGIAAAVLVGVHFCFILVLLAQGDEFTLVKADEQTEEIRWGYIPTRLNATMFYMAAVFYPDNRDFTPKGRMLISMITGVFEMVRTMLILMLLSCLARAALDEELAHRCTRAAGIASVGPGLLSLVFVIFVATMIETNAGTGTFVRILSATVQMGVYAIVVGTIFPAFLAAREVADACDEPFQSLIPHL